MPKFPLLTHFLDAAPLALECRLQHCEMGLQNGGLHPEIGYCLLHRAVPRGTRDATALPCGADASLFGGFAKTESGHVIIPCEWAPRQLDKVPRPIEGFIGAKLGLSRDPLFGGQRAVGLSR
jgi:hypothetical protein